eukprot:103206-Pelagomonas_calceolata.AAC.1
MACLRHACGGGNAQGSITEGHTCPVAGEKSWRACKPTPACASWQWHAGKKSLRPCRFTCTTCASHPPTSSLSCATLPRMQRCVHARAHVATLPRIVAKRWPDAGGVDVLINNAGLSRNDASLMEGNVASWCVWLGCGGVGGGSFKAGFTLMSDLLSTCHACCPRFMSGGAEHKLEGHDDSLLGLDNVSEQILVTCLACRLHFQGGDAEHKCVGNNNGDQGNSAGAAQSSMGAEDCVFKICSLINGHSQA